jgi:hypothetical protein
MEAVPWCHISCVFGSKSGCRSLGARRIPLRPAVVCFAMFSIQAGASYKQSCCSHLELAVCLLLFANDTNATPAGIVHVQHLQ